jgi:hypothetical protein
MTTNQNQELRWKLTGIQAEQQKHREYLKVLDEAEKTTRDQLMTGQTVQASKPGRPKQTATTGDVSAEGGKRKRVITKAQRERMAEGARKRWAERKAAKSGTTQTATQAEAVEVPDIPLTH